MQSPTKPPRELHRSPSRVRPQDFGDGIDDRLRAVAGNVVIAFDFSRYRCRIEPAEIPPLRVVVGRDGRPRPIRSDQDDDWNISSERWSRQHLPAGLVLSVEFSPGCSGQQEAQGNPRYLVSVRHRPFTGELRGMGRIDQNNPGHFPRVLPGEQLQVKTASRMANQNVWRRQMLATQQRPRVFNDGSTIARPRRGIAPFHPWTVIGEDGACLRHRREYPVPFLLVGEQPGLKADDGWRGVETRSLNLTERAAYELVTRQ